MSRARGVHKAVADPRRGFLLGLSMAPLSACWAPLRICCSLRTATAWISPGSMTTSACSSSRWPTGFSCRPSAADRPMDGAKQWPRGGGSGNDRDVPASEPFISERVARCRLPEGPARRRATSNNPLTRPRKCRRSPLQTSPIPNPARAEAAMIARTAEKRFGALGRMGLVARFMSRPCLS